MWEPEEGDAATFLNFAHHFLGAAELGLSGIHREMSLSNTCEFGVIFFEEVGVFLSIFLFSFPLSKKWQ